MPDIQGDRKSSTIQELTVLTNGEDDLVLLHGTSSSDPPKWGWDAPGVLLLNLGH